MHYGGASPTGCGCRCRDISVPWSLRRLSVSALSAAFGHRLPAGNQPGRPGQARLECRPQFWFSFCWSFSVSQATDLAGHRLRAAIDDTLTGHYRHTCKRLILIATDPLGLRVCLHLLLLFKLLFKLF